VGRAAVGKGTPNDPETLADVLEPHDWGVLPEGLDLLHLVDEACRNRTGRNDFEEEFRRRHPPEPCDDHGEEVWESVEELERRFPRLCARVKSGGTAEPGVAADPARPVASCDFTAP
jgi:hypothetical protein